MEKIEGTILEKLFNFFQIGRAKKKLWKKYSKNFDQKGGACPPFQKKKKKSRFTITLKLGTKIEGTIITRGFFLFSNRISQKKNFA